MRIVRALLATSGTQEFGHNKYYGLITIIMAISFQEKNIRFPKITIWVEVRRISPGKCAKIPTFFSLKQLKHNENKYFSFFERSTFERSSKLHHFYHYSMQKTENVTI